MVALRQRVQIFIFRVAYKFTMFLRQITPDGAHPCELSSLTWLRAERGYLISNPMRYGWA